jgi:hypothetical protein
MVGLELAVGGLDEVGACVGCAEGKLIDDIVGDIVVGRIIVVGWDGGSLGSSEGKSVCTDG